MSTFRVPLVRIVSIEAIPDADKIELAVVGDYRSVVGKGEYAPGDLAVYFPEAAILPANLIETMGLTGRLSGNDQNRVKAVKLRGCISQGVLYKPDWEAHVSPSGKTLAYIMPNGKIANQDDDLADFFEVTKYEPRIPANMMGELTAMYGMTLDFDVENFKAYPNVIEDGEQVEFTEKVHGTFCAITQFPGLNHPDMLDTDTLVYSKGLGARGMVFKDNDANENNLYLRTVKEYEIAARMRKHNPVPTQPLTLLGEVYGPGVQDLQYGMKKPSFMLFDMYLGEPGQGYFGSRHTISHYSNRMGLPQTPILYRGPYSREKLDHHTSGPTVAGNRAHIREGLVITPVAEREDPKLGRVILKSINPDYLFRKTKNQTEYT